MRVHEIDVANVRVEDVRVANECVVDVDDVDEVAAAAEPGEERLAKTKREPAYAEAEPKTPASAKEPNERRSINGRPKERSGAPAPRAANERPAAVMKWSKTPGIVVNPSPTPRIDPPPITVAVGSPTRRHSGGVPHVAVFWLVAPRAVVIEIVITGHVARHIVTRNRAIFFQVALFRPTIQSVGPGCMSNVVGGILHT